MTVSNRQNDSIDTSTYWRRISLAVFLLIPTDLVMTYLAADAVGIHREINPLMRWLIEQGLAVTIVAHLIAIIVLICLLVGFEYVTRHADDHGPKLMDAANVYLLILILFGCILLVNNTAIIFTAS